MARQPSAKLRAQLREFVTDEQVPGFGSTADEFAELVCYEAASVAAWLDQPRASRRDLQREIDALVSALEEAERRTRNLSDDADRLLGAQADPEALLEHLLAIGGCARSARASADSRPGRDNPVAYRHRIAAEMALRVLRVLDDYGIPAAATCNPDHGFQSDAVTILKLVGDDLGLPLSPATWRDVILKVQRDV